MLSNPTQCPGTHHWQRYFAIETFQYLPGINSVRFPVKGGIIGMKTNLRLFFYYAETD